MKLSRKPMWLLHTLWFSSILVEVSSVLGRLFFSSEHRFGDALPLLRKAVGFRPKDAWLFYQVSLSRGPDPKPSINRTCGVYGNTMMVLLTDWLPLPAWQCQVQVLRSTACLVFHSRGRQV